MSSNNMIRPANPFVIGKYLGDKYFCDRVEETEMLYKHVVNGRNVTLSSPRRMGKTGLINHFFNRQKIKEEYLTVFIDIYATGCLSEFVYLLSNAVYASVSMGIKNKIEHFFRSISSLRMGLTFDAVTGEPTFDLKLGQIKSPEDTLSQVFRYLDEQSKPVIVAIDEFQQIGEYPEKNTEALLRTFIQKSRNIQFIYAGSKQHIIGNMFTSPSKPFYQSTLFMDLLPIPCDVYGKFAHRMFEDYGKHLVSGIVEEIYGSTHGVTWYNQVMLNELFAITAVGKTCGGDMLQQALSNIVNANSHNYIDMLSRLSERQRALLLSISKNIEVSDIMSAEFIRDNGLLSASSVQSALRALLKLGIVTAECGRYRVSDFFFSQWLRNY